MKKISVLTNKKRYPIYIGDSDIDMHFAYKSRIEFINVKDLIAFDKIFIEQKSIKEITKRLS